MHASVWKFAPHSEASAARSGIGSITPCGYCGAESTMSTVFAVISAAIASTSARQSARTGTDRTSPPNECPALWNAACALLATTISGFVIPRSIRPRSRAASTAMRMLSVPPDVMKPAVAASPWSRSAVMRTTSDWNEARLGNAIVFSALSCR
jgi:hypothetical protein